jgi:hypothetical protein
LTSPDVQAVNNISTQVGALKIYSGQLGDVNSAKAGVVMQFEIVLANTEMRRFSHDPKFSLWHG